MNDRHQPPGSPIGGQFAAKSGGSSSRGGERSSARHDPMAHAGVDATHAHVRARESTQSRGTASLTPSSSKASGPKGWQGPLPKPGDRVVHATRGEGVVEPGPGHMYSHAFVRFPGKPAEWVHVDRLKPRGQ